jgi:hypothetical protein
VSIFPPAFWVSQAQTRLCHLLDFLMEHLRPFLGTWRVEDSLARGRYMKASGYSQYLLVFSRPCPIRGTRELCRPHSFRMHPRDRSKPLQTVGARSGVMDLRTNPRIPPYPVPGTQKRAFADPNRHRTHGRPSPAHKKKSMNYNDRTSKTQGIHLRVRGRTNYGS